MKYLFIYKNQSSEHTYECDADAMKEARKELETMRKLGYHTVHVWERKTNGKYRYIVSYC